MNRLLAALIVALLLTGSAIAQVVVPGPVSHQELTVTTAVSTLNCSGPNQTAFIQTNGAGIRFTLAGETPNTTDSYLLADGDFLGVNLPGNFKMIRAAGTNATVKSTCLQN